MTQQHQGLSQAGKNILNLLLVQAVWFACEMGGTL